MQTPTIRTSIAPPLPQMRRKKNATYQARVPIESADDW